MKPLTMTHECEEYDRNTAAGHPHSMLGAIALSAYRELDAARAALPVALRRAVDEAWWGKYPDDTAEHASTLREAIVKRVMEGL